jgi:hypothetical protein
MILILVLKTFFFLCLQNLFYGNKMVDLFGSFFGRPWGDYHEPDGELLPNQIITVTVLCACIMNHSLFCFICLMIILTLCKGLLFCNAYYATVWFAHECFFIYSIVFYMVNMRKPQNPPKRTRLNPFVDCFSETKLFTYSIS